MQVSLDFRMRVKLTDQELDSLLDLPTREEVRSALRDAMSSAADQAVTLHSKWMFGSSSAVSMNVTMRRQGEDT